MLFMSDRLIDFDEIAIIREYLSHRLGTRRFCEDV